MTKNIFPNDRISDGTLKPPFPTIRIILELSLWLVLPCLSKWYFLVVGTRRLMEKILTLSFYIYIYIYVCVCVCTYILFALFEMNFDRIRHFPYVFQNRFYYMWIKTVSLLFHSNELRVTNRKLSTKKILSFYSNFL